MMAPSSRSDSAFDPVAGRPAGLPAVELVAIGAELLSGRRSEGNARAAQRLLGAVGLTVQRVTVVGDRTRSIAEAVREACRRADLVIVSGGLGPTFDDCTREGLAEAANVPLAHDPRAAEMVAATFARSGRAPSPSNQRQAMMPAGATPLANAIGSAPGIQMCVGTSRVFALPGVPEEFIRMLEDEVLGRLCDLGVVSAVTQRGIRIVGVPESEVGERIESLPEDLREHVVLGITAEGGTICVSLEAAASCRHDVERLEGVIKDAFGEAVFGTGDLSLAEATGRRLIESHTTLAVAESCTGGLLAERLTSVPGISRVFLEGCVAYSNEAKMRTLDVPRRILETHGAVSREVAVAMATGIAARAASDLGVGITGIAGPTGGTPEKPVGLVYLSLFDRGDVTCRELRLNGDRRLIRERATVAALDAVRRAAGKRSSPSH